MLRGSFSASYTFGVAEQNCADRHEPENPEPAEVHRAYAMFRIDGERSNLVAVCLPAAEPLLATR